MADQQQEQPVGNIKMEYNTGTTGINMDQSVSQIAKGVLTYALNAAVENFDANSVNYQPEPGNEWCLDFPTGYKLIGEHFINEQNKHVFFLANPETGGSEIGYMLNNDCIYHTYINASCLNFNIAHPILKAVHKITNCSTEIYWTDGYNSRRYLNLDDITSVYTTKFGTDVCADEKVPIIDCNKLKIQPNFNIPNIKVDKVTNGGDLVAGTYQFAIQYCDSIGDGYTSYYSVTNPTPIADINLTTRDFNYSVGKSIWLNITNIDITGYYQYFNIAVIKTVNNSTSVELVGTYFIDKSEKEIVYTGQNKTQIKLAIEEIFEKFPYYDIAQDLTAVQDLLVWDNLTSIDKINYQKIANQINLNWQTYKIPETENYADELNATNLRGYLRDEVYAFEIVFLLKNGRQTDGFHIPGRAAVPSDMITVDGATNDDYVGEGTYGPYWKVYNTASVFGDATGENIGNATPYKYGEFAYWESTELYPCNETVWGPLANTPIRHHKFPDVLVSPIFESATPELVLGKYSVQMHTARSVFPIGVKIDIDDIKRLISISDLTQTQKDDIVGFKIVRGDRATNKSIVAKGMLRNVGKYTKEGTDYYFPNYPYNDLNEDVFLNANNNAYSLESKTWLIKCTTTGTYQITDPNTNKTAVNDMVKYQIITVCSLTRPIHLTGGAIIGPANYKIYRASGCEGRKGYRIYWKDPFTNDNSDYIDRTEFLQGTTYPLGCQTIDGTDPFSNMNVRTAHSIIVEIDGEVTDNSNDCIHDVPFACKKDITLLQTVTDNTCDPEAPLNAFTDEDLKYRQVFNSPETSFGRPFLGDILKLESVLYGGGKAHFVEVKKNALYKLISKLAQEKALESSLNAATVDGDTDITGAFTAYQAYLEIYLNGITRRNYAYSFNSIASYDYSDIVPNNLGVKQRSISSTEYLIPGVQSVGTDSNINNYQRESSVYVKTNIDRSSLPFPSDSPYINPSGSSRLIEDESRLTISGSNACNKPSEHQDITSVIYYASLKNEFVNQWGQMYSYETIDTGFQVDLDTTKLTQATVFGGDTFINKFAYKTKLPFFFDNRVGAPDDSDIFYDEIGNVAYPRYWHSSRSILDDYTYNEKTYSNIISYKAHNFDCYSGDPTSVGQVDPGTTETYYDGYFYLFAYGVPSFYCESSVNVDLRQAFNNKEGDFWPHVSTDIPDDWVQESNVPIAFDNTYYYNVTYSKQNKENYFSHLPVDWKPLECNTYFPFRAIYSDRQQSVTDDTVNSWLIYRPLSKYDFPQNYGKLISLDGIQNRAVLARFENKTLLYNNLLTIDTSNPQAAYVGNPKLFENPAVDFAETDLGYVGSQNKMLLKIPQGQVTLDAKRGQVFLLNGTQATDLSAFGSGLNRFFTDHLAFEILRYFPMVNTDNHFNSIGLHGVYDSKYDRVIISKLDYIPLPDKGVKYDSVKQEFYIEKEIDVIISSTTTSSSTSSSTSTTSSTTTMFLERLNVKDFGAIGNGIADDTEAFQNCIDEAADKKLGVYVPEGDYNIHYLLIPSNTDILGTANSVLIQYLKADPTLPQWIQDLGYLQPLIEIYAPSNNTFIENVKIDNLTLDGKVQIFGFNEGVSLMSLAGTKNVTLNNIRFIGFRGDGITMASGWNPNWPYPGTSYQLYNVNTTITNCLFDGVNNDNRQGISPLQTDGLLIENCTFIRTTRSGPSPLNPDIRSMPGAIDFEPDTAWSVIKNVTIKNNTFSDIGGSFVIGFIFNDWGVAEVSNILVENNTITNIPLSINDDGNPCVFYYTSISRQTTNIVIKNNTVSDCYRPFVLKDTTGFTLQGNNFSNINKSGDIHGSGNGANDIQIKSNTFNRVGTSGNCAFATFITDGMNINGNTFNDCGGGVPGDPNDAKGIFFLNGTSSNVSLTDNTFLHPSDIMKKATECQSLATFTGANIIDGNQFNGLTYCDFSNSLNVKTYGAIGDGITDDTSAIQDTIDAAISLGKPGVYFPTGTYLIGSYTITPNYLENYSLLLSSDLHFFGDGDTSILKTGNNLFDSTSIDANAHMFYGTNIDNVTFSNLLIDQNGANNLAPVLPSGYYKTCKAIFIINGSNFTARNITIKNCPGHNMIAINGVGDTILVENCTFLNGGHYVGTSTPNSNNTDFSFIYFEWDHTTVQNNHIEQQDIDIALTGYTGGVELHGSHCIAQDNTFIGCWPAIYLSSQIQPVGTSKKDILIKNNIMNDCVNGVIFFVNKVIEDVIIEDNTITLTNIRASFLGTDFISVGILVPHGNWPTYSDDLANNAPLYNITIQNNSITGNLPVGTTYTSAGMILHSFNNSNILNNTISGMNYCGFTMQGSKWGVDGLNIQGNTITDYKAAPAGFTITRGHILIEDYAPIVPFTTPGFFNIDISSNILSESIDIPGFYSIFVGGTASDQAEVTIGTNTNANYVYRLTL